MNEDGLYIIIIGIEGLIIFFNACIWCGDYIHEQYDEDEIPVRYENL